MMRGLRSTIALLVVLIGLGAYIYFVTSKQTDETAGSKLAKVFASVPADQIEELTVKSESGETTTVRKESGAWQVVLPISAAASEPDVSSITAALAALEIERVIDENPTDLKEYGLEAPRLEVDFKAAGGKSAGRLSVGNKTPTGASMYARRNDEKQVFLVAEYQNSSLNKSTFDLRDKAVVKVERDKVDGLEVTIAGKPIRFAKTAGEWKLVQPIEAPADFASVEGLVGRVESAQMKAVVADQPSPVELKKYGLERPDVTLTFNLGSARATVALGANADEDTVYARDTSRPAVFTVERSLADEMKKGAEDYRRKDVFEFRAFNATRAEFGRGGQTVVFERVKGQGENASDSWRRVSPAPADADRSKVESLLAGLADVRATSFVASTAKTGLDSPALTVSVTFDEGKKEERVAFGKSGDDVYAQVPGQPGAAVIEAEKFTEALKALDELSK